MKRRSSIFWLLLSLMVSAFPPFASAISELNDGATIFARSCMSCHEMPGSPAPTLSDLKAKSADALMSALTEGKMSVQGSHLSANERKALVGWLTQDQQPVVEWQSAATCNDNAVDLSGEPYVTRWGFDSHHHRYQSKTSLNAENAHQLKLKWAFALPRVTDMRSQPAIVGDTLFLAVAEAQTLYALNRHSGCVKWSYKASVPLRSAVGYGALFDGKSLDGQKILFVGDVLRGLHVVDAASGDLIWHRKITDTNTAMITGSVALHDGVLYVPQSQYEILAAASPDYQCCKDHGSVIALDAATGKQLWVAEMTEDAKPTRKNAIGIQQWGPSGAPVWTSPLIDAARGVLYIGTGENTSRPTTETSDAVIALDLKTGERRWLFQGTKDDAYNNACPGGPNCPENTGPDFDFGASMILTKTSTGKPLILAGQKSGMVWALDPDNNGALVWQRSLSQGTALGGIHWGMTVQDGKVFVPVNDPVIGERLGSDKKPFIKNTGLYALSIDTGEVIWSYRPEPKPCRVEGGQTQNEPNCRVNGLSGAALGIPGAIVTGDLDGRVRINRASDGRLLWSYDTVRSYETVNGIKGQGGSIDNANITAAGDTLYVQSGYNTHGRVNMSGNVLLAFEVEEEK